MLRCILVFMGLFLFSEQNGQDIPPFIFPDIDGAAMALWMAADDVNEPQSALADLKLVWRRNQSQVEDFPMTAYNPLLLSRTLNEMIIQIEKSLAYTDDQETKQLSYTFYDQFSIVRRYHGQNYYPLDAWWDAYRLYEEIHEVTHDSHLGLLEWQELECLFDEFVCLIQDYEYKAETYLTQYVPHLDEDEHKAAINRIYECIHDYQETLEGGYQNQLEWPCDQIGVSIKAILRTYLLPVNEHM